MRAAIVGPGYVARVHAHALRDLGVEVAAVCGRTRGRAEAFGLGIPYGDLAELLDRERPDVLHVCTPNGLHVEEALLALERGVHVVCEKPLASTAAESARMLEAAEASGLVHATMYHARGYPLVQQLRAEVEAGALGRIRFVHGRYVNDEGLLGSPAWHSDPALSGPTYVSGDLGSHWLDLAEHVSGLRVAEVLADFRSYASAPLEDVAAILLRFEDGATGSVVFSVVFAGRKNQLLLECEGERGGAAWDQERPDELCQRPLGAPVSLVVKDPAANVPRAAALARYPAGHGEGYGGAFRNVLREVYRAVAGEEHGGHPTFADGHRGMLILDAVAASARTGGWVKL